MKHARGAKRWRWIAWALNFVAAGAATLGTAWEDYPWPLELWVHWPELWLSILGLAALHALVIGRWVRAGTWSALLAWGLIAIQPEVGMVAPQFGTAADANTHAATVRLYFANLWCERAPTQAALELFDREPTDIIALVEFTPAWQAFAEARLHQWPHQINLPRTDPYGLAVASRWPIEVQHAGPLGSAGFPFALVRVLHPEQTFYLALAHPRSPLSPVGWWGRNRYLRDLSTALEKVAGPRILVGDLNAVPWSPLVRQISQRTGLLRVQASQRWSGSWPSYLPPLLRRSIDHVFLDPTLQLLGYELLDPCVSDHLSLRVRIGLIRT